MQGRDRRLFSASGSEAKLLSLFSAVRELCSQGLPGCPSSKALSVQIGQKPPSLACAFAA